MAWQCLKCGWLQVSDSRERHQMDYCKCGATALDLEETYARIVGVGNNYKPLMKKTAASNVWKMIRQKKKEAR